MGGLSRPSLGVRIRQILGMLVLQADSTKSAAAAGPSQLAVWLVPVDWRHVPGESFQ